MRAPRRNLKPYKSAIVWATRGACRATPFSSSQGSDLRVEGIAGGGRGKKLLFPPSRWRLTRISTCASLCVCLFKTEYVCTTVWVVTLVMYAYISVLFLQLVIHCALVRGYRNGDGLWRGLYNLILLSSFFSTVNNGMFNICPVSQTWLVYENFLTNVPRSYCNTEAVMLGSHIIKQNRGSNQILSSQFNSPFFSQLK